MSAVALFMENQKPMECEDCTVKSSRMSGPCGIKETAVEITQVLGPQRVPPWQLRPGSSSLFLLFVCLPQVYWEYQMTVWLLPINYKVLGLSEQLSLWLQELTISRVRSRFLGAKAV